MNYAIAIHKERKSGYGVTVPALPGCFSSGDTIDEAMANAQDAIGLHLEGLIEEGQAIPAGRPVDEYLGDAEYKGATWAVISVDLDRLPLKVHRINITMPERVLSAVDRYAEKHGETRSGLLVRAVTSLIAK